MGLIPFNEESEKEQKDINNQLPDQLPAPKSNNKILKRNPRSKSAVDS